MPNSPDSSRTLLAFAAGWVSATLFSAFMAHSISGTAAIASSAIAITLFLAVGLVYAQVAKAPSNATKSSKDSTEEALEKNEKRSAGILPSSSAPPASSAPSPTVRQPEPVAAPLTLDQRCEAYARTHDLTPRQGEVLRLLADGLPAAAIAEELYLSKDTIKTHTKAIYAKAGVHSRQELLAALYAQEG